jgi:hypothetical protein
MMKQLVTLVTRPSALPESTRKQLATILASDAYTTGLLLKREPPVILGNPCSVERADDAVAALCEAGAEAYAIGFDDFNALPAAEPVRTLEFHRDHLRFAVGADETRLSPWDNVFLLMHGICKAQKRTSTVDTTSVHHLKQRDVAGVSESMQSPSHVHAVGKLAPHVIVDQGYKTFAGALPLGVVSRAAGGSGDAISDDYERFDFYSRLMFFIHLKRAEKRAGA